MDASFRLLDEIHVATIPGEIFYAPDRERVGAIRFQFAVENDVLADVEWRLTSGL